eukprot:811769-Rhodomonas_salina.4
MVAGRCDPPPETLSFFFPGRRSTPPKLFGASSETQVVCLVSGTEIERPLGGKGQLGPWGVPGSVGEYTIGQYRAALRGIADLRGAKNVLFVRLGQVPFGAQRVSVADRASGVRRSIEHVSTGHGIGSA